MGTCFPWKYVHCDHCSVLCILYVRGSQWVLIFLVKKKSTFNKYSCIISFIFCLLCSSFFCELELVGDFQDFVIVVFLFLCRLV